MKKKCVFYKGEDDFSPLCDICIHACDCGYYEV